MITNNEWNGLYHPHIQTLTEDEENTITQNVLQFLDDYILDTDTETIDYNKKVNKNTILELYNNVNSEVISYLNTDEHQNNPVIQNFICMWTAGELWRKYNVRVNDQLDENYPIGYGDQLIISAKASLKPYRKYRLTAWG